MWVKKCVEMYVMLFKMWKFLFELSGQTGPLLFPSPYTLPSPFLCFFLTFFWNVFPMHNFETISLYLVEKPRKMASLFNNTDQQCDNSI